MTQSIFKCIRCGCSSYSVRNLMDDLHDYCTCNECSTNQKITQDSEKPTLHLYTPKDVAKVREELYKEQRGIDPILLEHFELKGACMDHSHDTQRVRAVLHRQCNAWEGKVRNAYVRCLKWVTDKPLPELLRNLADYYEDQDRIQHTKPVHSGWIKRVTTDFRSLSEGNKKAVLELLGQPQGGNATERLKLFKKAIMSRKFTFDQVSKLIQERK